PRAQGVIWSPAAGWAFPLGIPAQGLRVDRRRIERRARVEVPGDFGPVPSESKASDLAGVTVSGVRGRRTGI
ncbi:MAG: hypothetical protein JXA57_20815, partial [Armatimonadetes bacterium]|nr:hypothetical protein [Armatimonadota bacterium]